MAPAAIIAAIILAMAVAIIMFMVLIRLFTRGFLYAAKKSGRLDIDREILPGKK